MKKKIKIFLPILVFLLFLNFSSLYSQTNYQEAFVVTNLGDTLKGRIDFRDWSRSPKKIDFIEAGTTGITKFTANELIEFSVVDQKYISRNVTIDTTPIKVSQVKETLRSGKIEQVFLKVLVEGSLSLYEYKEARENFYIEENQNIIELISHEYVANVRGKFLLDDTEVEKYLDQLDQLETNCSSISKRRLSYRARNLIWFVESCNEYEETGESVYIPELKTATIKANPYFGYSQGKADYNFRKGRLGPEESDVAKTNSIVLGIKLLFFLPNSVNQRAVTVSLDFMNHKVGELDYFQDFNSTNFRIGYLILENPGRVSPYFEGALVFSARGSNYFRDSDNESFLIGFNIGAGIKVKPFNIGLSIDSANKRNAGVKQTGVSLLIGIGL